MATVGVGFFAGVFNAAIAIGLPPIAAYALHLGWERTHIVGTMNVAALILLALTCIIQAGAGLYTSEVLHLAFTGSVASVAGVACATPFAKKVPLILFKRILLVIIAWGGISCVWRGFGL